VEKPFGLATQGSNLPDLYSLLTQEHDYIGLHHRLDQAASGLVLFTLKKSSNKAIALAFKEHTIRRCYLAALAGRLPEDTTWRWDVDGRAACSFVRVIGTNRGRSAVEIELESGRKHQIRKHAAMSGYPILGDRRYGAEAGRVWPRLALHAYRLELVHPISGEDLKIESPSPADLYELWNECIHPGESRVSPKP
jgi:23S rRNA-/tRNA-specific pseudouridylate synthase